MPTELFAVMSFEGCVCVVRQLLLAHPYGQPNVLSSPGFIPDPAVDSRVDPKYNWNGIPALTPSDTKLARVYDDNGEVSAASLAPPFSVHEQIPSSHWLLLVV